MPDPSIPTAITTVSGTSMPVRGSDVDGSAPVADVEAVVVVAFDDNDELAAVDGGAVVAGDVDEPDGGAVEVEPWLLEPDGDDPASGSTYCWSPADPPPPAMAAAGASIARAAIAKTKPRIWRRRLTLRVLHPGRPGGRGPGTA